MVWLNRLISVTKSITLVLILFVLPGSVVFYSRIQSRLCVVRRRTTGFVAASTLFRMERCAGIFDGIYHTISGKTNAGH